MLVIIDCHGLDRFEDSPWSLILEYIFIPFWYKALFYSDICGGAITKTDL